MQEIKVYKQAELPQFNEIIIEATNLWRELSRKVYEEIGDSGSVIVGDGIGVYYLPPRCRKPQKLLIIPASRIASAQGSIHYERTKDEVIEFLKSKGLEAHYNYGRMD